eukprot:CAMPEP_0184493232 /NCGR_PEP_ID=MMETSP0113_2-20130426/25470_1 /TAXON_ID=91329 /ORGANISM="Norrisiella sphaerica, Strain BC52" /LENGTH=405 /DNA_ID=CAMNT_0026878429 /DNA_START=403 /DNA_END=1620 /DNA_ORIENTATION=-
MLRNHHMPKAQVSGVPREVNFLLSEGKAGHLGLHRASVFPNLPAVLPSRSSEELSGRVAAKFHVATSAAIPGSSDKQSEKLAQIAGSIKKAAQTLWRFSRPHTIIGTITSVAALHLMMVPSDMGIGFVLNPLFLKTLIPTLISALLLNLYIVGLNQVTDVEIDRVNKPDLPIANGDLSKGNAIGIILAALLGGLAIGYTPELTSLPLQLTLLASGILGTLYSLPPFRLKRFPTSAALCISAVRGFVINWGFAAHAFIKLSVAGAAAATSTLFIPALPLQVTLIATFYTVYGVVIALAKDVPDVKGDEGHGIKSFSVRMGQKKILSFAQWLLSGLHLVAAGILLSAAQVSNPIGRTFVAVLAVLGSESIRRERQGVDATVPDAAYKYYMHLWKMFYFSYFTLPLIR